MAVIGSGAHGMQSFVLTIAAVREQLVRARQPPARRQAQRLDEFADLAERLRLDEELVRTELVGRPEMLQVLNQVKFAESEPGPHEEDGSDPKYFQDSYEMPFPEMNRTAVTEPLPRNPQTHVHEQPVDFHDILDVSDRQLIADHLNAFVQCEKLKWEYREQVVRDPAAPAPSFPAVPPVVIPAQRIKRRECYWSCADPRACVPLEAAYRPKPKLNGEVFRKMCEAAGIEDYQLMDMVDQGVSGLDESRPYAIVLNGNYASLAPYYGPVFEKAVKEVSQGQLRRFTVEPEHFTAENVWLPCVPINIDSTGSATRSSDDKPVGLKKARRTVGGGSPETMPEYSGNQHARVEEQWPRVILDGVAQHAKYNAILYHPAKALKEELCGASCDFEGYYNQFHQAVYEWAHSCFAMVTPEGKLEVFMSEVMQFGRSYGPAVGQSMMDAICEITRQEFDRGDRPVIQAALRAEARQSGRRRGLAGPLSMWMRRRETIARKLVDEEEKRREASGYFEVNFGQRIRELGFVEDVKRFVVILPDDKRARLIAWLAEARD
ncbi:hypothetical protein JL722_10842 [Aureococcus anophagefferens]|nr:hypothetical protein JL722_10842 [Aureococcus anophagefferens]